jgi:hypothetical protein
LGKGVKFHSKIKQWGGGVNESCESVCKCERGVKPRGDNNSPNEIIGVYDSKRVVLDCEIGGFRNYHLVSMNTFGSEDVRVEGKTKIKRVELGFRAGSIVARDNNVDALGLLGGDNGRFGSASL